MDVTRLVQQEADLRAEGTALLAASGLGALLAEAGFVPVGSQVMRTMTWRDLDFERYAEPDFTEFCQLGARLAATGWCTRLQCVDHYRERTHTDEGLYCGLRVASPERTAPAGKDDPTVWKLDLWTAREPEFEPGLTLRRRWLGLLDEPSRVEILAIKEAVCRRPEYRHTLLSVHIYEAVLERGLRGVEEFLRWWQAEKAPRE